MEPSAYLFAGVFVVAMLVGAINQKFRTVAIVLAIAAAALYPSSQDIFFVLVFVIPGLVLAGFSE